MKTITILLFFLSMQIFAQEKHHTQNIVFDKYLYFLPHDSAIVLLAQELSGNEYKTLLVSNYYLIILSTNDGKVISKIPLHLPKNMSSLYTMAISHDGLYCVALTKDKDTVTKYWQQSINSKGLFTLSQFSLVDNRCIWERRWDSDYRSLGLAYSADNKQIIGSSIQNTITIDAETGSLIKKGNNISNIQDFDGNLFYNLSQNGKYLAFWSDKYLRWSQSTESFTLKLLDFGWYGLRWLYHLGSIPNYIYIWDNYNDTLHYKIQIPYEETWGRPTFWGEKELLVGPLNEEYQVFSLEEKKIVRKYPQNEYNITGIKPWGMDNKLISPNKKYLAKTIDRDILLLNFDKDQLITRYEKNSGWYSYYNVYPMAFSSDSKYFACVTKKNKVILVESETGKVVWENTNFATK